MTNMSGERAVRGEMDEMLGMRERMAEIVK